MQACKKVLIIMAHPSISQSTINNPMFRLARQIENVTCIVLYAQYPNFRINAQHEQKLLLEHDVIIFQFPIYWYSTPSLLKEWQDVVLTHGFAYGSTGNALYNKQFLCAVSAGGSQKSYRSSGMFQYNLRSALSPLEMTCNLVGMDFIPPFALYSAAASVNNGALTQHLQQWRQLILALTQDRFDIRKAQKYEFINNKMNNLIKGDK